MIDEERFKENIKLLDEYIKDEDLLKRLAEINHAYNNLRAQVEAFKSMLNIEDES